MPQTKTHRNLVKLLLDVESGRVRLMPDTQIIDTDKVLEHLNAPLKIGALDSLSYDAVKLIDHIPSQPVLQDLNGYMFPSASKAKLAVEGSDILGTLFSVFILGIPAYYYNFTDAKIELGDAEADGLPLNQMIHIPNFMRWKVGKEANYKLLRAALDVVARLGTTKIKCCELGTSLYSIT